MKKIQIRLDSRSYFILIGKQLLENLAAHLNQAGVASKNALIVSQKEIADLYMPCLESALTSRGYSAHHFVAPGGKNSEKLKSEISFSKLIRHLSSLDGKNNSPFLIALGGGVVGDITGFAASVYRRGVPYVQIPTSLTAQVDSSIGGKTAIDLPQGKNLLGSIYQPRLVLADTGVLNTLPSRYWSDGFAEIIKYAAIRDPWLFHFLEKNTLQEFQSNSGKLEKVIFRCAKIKAGIVEKDEMDKKGLRIILNFGHTAGHAIEAASGYGGTYTHGEAVAIGMLIATEMARELGVLQEPAFAERLEKLILKFGLPLYFKGLSMDKILTAMGFDKKADAGINRFILPVAIGKTQIEKNIPSDLIARAVKTRQRV